jgi:uncharacterized phosphatase
VREGVLARYEGRVSDLPHRTRPGRVLLVRHGESEGNRLRQFSRDNGIDLTERGVAQARAAGAEIRERFAPTRMIASPYHRTRRTAGLIAETLGHSSPIEIEPALREREIGELAGAPYEAMRAHPEYRAELFWHWRPLGGQAIQAAGGETVVVSHGGVMLALRAHVEGGWGGSKVSGNCEILVVEMDVSGRLRIRSLAEHDDGPPGGEATG